MSLVCVHAVLGFFRNVHCIIVSRSSPASARVSALYDRKKCVVNAVCFPALRACNAFGISGADMRVFTLIDAPAFGRWETFGEKYASVVFQLSADCSYGACSHTYSVVFCGHRMIGTVPHRLSPLEIKSGGRILWWS